MKIERISFKVFLVVMFYVATVLAQPPAAPENEDLNTLLAQGFERQYGDPRISFISQNAKPGDATSGVEVARTSVKLYIDATPCVTGRPKRIFAFVKPYKEGKVSDAVCSGKRYPQIQVIQQ